MRPDWMAEKGGLWAIVPILPSDYHEYGGDVVRWSDPDSLYGDCSTCRWFVTLDPDTADVEGLNASYDWGVCANPASPRAGLLTWEHMAGHGCHEIGSEGE